MDGKALDLIGVANELEAFILATVPECSTVSKYGGTLFTLKPEEKEGQFCGVFIYSKHVQLSISNGADLEDERKVLQGSGKHRKHINFTNREEIDFEYIKGLLCQASEL